MKTLNNKLAVLLSIVLVSGLVLISGCGGGTDPEPEPTPGDLALISLATSTWKVGSVTVDGVDKTSLFTGLTLTFTSNQTLNSVPTAFAGSFTAVNGGPVWPAQGNWTITDPSVGTNLTRSDGVTVQISEPTTSSIKLSLAWSKNTFGTGKISSVKGQHVFTMTK